jgi:hypothetical protein
MNGVPTAFSGRTVSKQLLSSRTKAIGKGFQSPVGFSTLLVESCSISAPLINDARRVFENSVVSIVSD